MEESTGGQLDGESFVIRALRRPGDEVQLERVLAAVCAEPRAAKAFAAAVVDDASNGNPRALRRLGEIPDDVRTRREHVMPERVIGRRGLRRVWRGGRADLRLVGAGGWELIVELKIDAKINPAQVDTYLTEAPTVVLARRVDETPHLSRWIQDEGWLGIATWSGVLEPLYALPLEGGVRADWHRLLHVADRDHDFAPDKPVSAEAQAAVDLLQEIGGRLLDHLRKEVERVHGRRGEHLAGYLRIYKAFPATQTRAELGLGATGQPWFFTVRLSGIFEQSPTLQIERSRVRDWKMGLGSRSDAKRGRELLMNAGALREGDSSSSFNAPEPAFRWIAGKLTQFVERGALAADVEGLTR